MKKLSLILLLFLFSCLSFGFASSQLDQAISRMNNNGLTKFTNAIDFMATKSLRRDEATKFFVQYATEILGLTPDTTKTSCNFTDLSKARPDLKDLIKESCQLGLFQGTNGKFMPTQSLTNAQAITVLIRMIDGKKDETQGHFAQKYFEKAQELGIMDGLSLNSTTNFDKLTTRGDVGILIYNASKLSNTPTTTDLYPLNLLLNQQRNIEFTVPLGLYDDVHELIFNVKRDGGVFETSTKERNKITGKIYASSDIYSAGLTYLQSGYYSSSDNLDMPILEVRYCFYIYEYIQEGFTCNTYYIDGNIKGNYASGVYAHYSEDNGGEMSASKLYSTYPVKIISKSSYSINECKYKGEVYRGEKIYHAQGTSRYTAIKQFRCFDTEAQAKAAGYKPSGLNP